LTLPKVREHLYVSTDNRIDLIAARLNAKLGLALVARDSAYWGVYYTDTSRLLDEIRLYLNIDPQYKPESDPPDGYWLEPDYREHPLLLYICGPENHVDAFNMRLWHACPRFDFGLRTSCDF
jgi:hypothetical protein